MCLSDSLPAKLSTFFCSIRFNSHFYELFSTDGVLIMLYREIFITLLS